MKERRDKKELYCCSSYYQVLIALMKALTQEQVVDLVLEEHGIETAGQLAERLNHQMKRCVDQVFVCPDSKKIDPYRQRCASFLPWQRIALLRHMEKIFTENLRKYSRIHVFWDLGYAGTYLNICRIPYILHEDSLNSYQHIRANRPNYAYIFRRNGWKFRIKKCFRLGVIPFGYSDCCRAVEVNEKAGIEIPPDKVREVSRKEIENRLMKEQKKELFSLFVTEDILGEVQNMQENVLLLTEPFAVTGRLPDENTQARLYQKVLFSYAENRKVLIKPHPRDTMDYRKYFPDAKVMEKNIPMEILNFDEDFQVFRAITVTSSVIQGLTCAKEQVFLGKDFLKAFSV